ncbi:hypothetical protein I350_02253 [Cryptococcus amylolentus CBS 6273]|nr:hypothetical protein I350_02253 [Cryptococcus amylolentus CBS 6273]
MKSRRPGGPTIQEKVFRSAWDTTPIKGKMLDDDGKVVGDHVTEQARVTVRVNGLSPIVPDGRAYITTLGLDSHLASLPVSESSALTNMLSRPSIYESCDPLPNARGTFALRELNHPVKLTGPLDIDDIPCKLWSMDSHGQDDFVRGRFNVSLSEAGTVEAAFRAEEEGGQQEEPALHPAAHPPADGEGAIIFEADYLGSAEPVSLSSLLDNDMSITSRGLNHPFSIDATVTAQDDGFKLVIAIWETTHLDGEWYTRGNPHVQGSHTRRGRARIVVQSTLPSESTVPLGDVRIATRGLQFEDDEVSQTEDEVSDRGDVHDTIQYSWEQEPDGSGILMPNQGSSCSLSMDGTVSWYHGRGRSGREQLSMTVAVQPSELYVPKFAKPFLR